MLRPADDVGAAATVKMGFLDKLKFWKREEEMPQFDMGKYPGLEATPPSAEMRSFAPPGSAGITEPPQLDELGPAPLPPVRGIGGMPAPSAFAPAPSAPAYDVSRDMQVVQAKLDTLKALLDSVIGKLERIERAQPSREEEAVPLSVRRWR